MSDGTGLIMPSPIDVYGALAAHVANNVGGIDGGVWVNEEPETKSRPYVVMEDKGFATEFSFESVYTNYGNIDFHVLADSSMPARTIGKAIRALLGPYNSEESITTDGTFTFIEVTETGFQLSVEPDTDREGAKVYRYTVSYKVGIGGTY